MDEQVPKAREIKHLTPAQSMLSGQIICELPRAPLLIRSRTLRKPKTPHTRSDPDEVPTIEWQSQAESGDDSQADRGSHAQAASAPDGRPVAGNGSGDRPDAVLLLWRPS
jgi:hypothetical protein